MRVIEGQPSRVGPTRPVERGRHDCGPPKWGATIRVRPAATSLRSGRMDDPSVGDLLQGAAGGDEACWTALVDRFASLVWSVASSFNLDRGSVEDVSQTVWLRLAEHCGRIQEPERLPGWLATTARNEALRVVRCRQRVEPQDRAWDQVQRTDSSVEDPVLGTETLHEVLQAFNGLDGESQQLLRLLCVVPPLDYRTISEITGRPVGSIGPTRRRCLEKLRKMLPNDRADESTGS